MTAYVALSCLIAFIIVISICLFKQFIWDPLLSKRFQRIRSILIEQFDKYYQSFQQANTSATMTTTTNTNMSNIDPSAKTKATFEKSNESPLLINLPSIHSQIDNSINKTIPRRSYGSSALSSHAYTNFASEDLNDESHHSNPIIHFSCEYNPSTFSIRLHVQNLRNMNSLIKADGFSIDRSACVFIRFTLMDHDSQKLFETSKQHVQEFIRFGESFTILTNVRAGDPLKTQIQFSLILTNGTSFSSIGEAIYSMKDEQLTHILFLERMLPMFRDKNSSGWDE